MKKAVITVIKGNRGSGKTTTAMKIIGKSCYVDLLDSEIGSLFEFRNIDKDTEYILIDGISSDNLNYIDFIFNSGKTLTIKSLGQLDYEVDMPNIICTIQE